jgi:hypothetical protein
MEAVTTPVATKSTNTVQIMIRSITSGVSAKNANPKQNDATLIIPDKINTKAGSSRAHWPY